MNLHIEDQWVFIVGGPSLSVTWLKARICLQPLWGSPCFLDRNLKKHIQQMCLKIQLFLPGHLQLALFIYFIMEPINSTWVLALIQVNIIVRRDLYILTRHLQKSYGYYSGGNSMTLTRLWSTYNTHRVKYQSSLKYKKCELMVTRISKDSYHFLPEYLQQNHANKKY